MVCDKISAVVTEEMCDRKVSAATCHLILQKLREHDCRIQEKKVYRRSGARLRDRLPGIERHRADELKTTWKQVTTSIKENSWNAIYAKTDAEFNKFVQKMKKDTAAYGYDECLKWCENEAATRRSLEKALNN